MKAVDEVTTLKKAEEKLKISLRKLMDGDESATDDFEKWSAVVESHPGRWTYQPISSLAHHHASPSARHPTASPLYHPTTTATTPPTRTNYSTPFSRAKD